MIFSDEDLKSLDALSKELDNFEFSEEDKRRFDELEKELAEMDLDFLMR